jgi:hypothetical protein
MRSVPIVMPIAKAKIQASMDRAIVVISPSNIQLRAGSAQRIDHLNS